MRFSATTALAFLTAHPAFGHRAADSGDSNGDTDACISFSYLFIHIFQIVFLILAFLADMCPACSTRGAPLPVARPVKPERPAKIRGSGLACSEIFYRPVHQAAPLIFLHNRRSTVSCAPPPTDGHFTTHLHFLLWSPAFSRSIQPLEARVCSPMRSPGKASGVGNAKTHDKKDLHPQTTADAGPFYLPRAKCRKRHTAVFSGFQRMPPQLSA